MSVHEPALDLLKARHTLSCSSSSFCSKTIISDFPCCAARKLKNRLHLTRTSENWSCSNTTQFINDLIILLHLNPIVMGLARHISILFTENHTSCSMSIGTSFSFFFEKVETLRHESTIWHFPYTCQFPSGLIFLPLSWDAELWMLFNNFSDSTDSNCSGLYTVMWI